jgi:4-hydroxy-tetrahydrodipicolinate synthase
MEAHFRAIADDGALPVLLYNVPSRTGSDMLPETTARLAGHPRIIGIKEARNDAARMQALLPLRGDGFAVLSGDDPTAARAMLAGADGLVSVASNVLPRALRRLCDLSRARRADDAMALDAQLQQAFDFLGLEPNPIPLKALLERMQFGHGLRLPLTSLSQQYSGQADLVATRIQQLEHACRDPIAA